jgi:glucan phosphoethanolaminetransferase (alkaline phosphatase superfamily)
MKDERIQTTVNRFAARAFFIWYLLTLISLNYRLLILKQHPQEFWDFIAIFIICTFFVFIAYANKGVFDHDFLKRSLTIGIAVSAIIGFFTWQFIAGRTNSVVEVFTSLIGFLSGMGLCIVVAHFLNRRWKRKEGIEDEK